MATTPRSGNPIEQPIPVTISQIADEDRWITNYHLYAAPLNNVESKREYFLLLLVKKIEDQEISLPEKVSWFVIDGFADKENKLIFAMKPREMAGKSSTAYTVLFDYEGGFLHRNRIVLAEGLELSSMKLKDN
ncbi:MAG: hypothetical protein JST85_20840 [Acidobacteria bacterium]|nr:hypothetical protein [Acidobacteriota bacterium]